MRGTDSHAGADGGSGAAPRSLMQRLAAVERSFPATGDSDDTAQARSTQRRRSPRVRAFFGLGVIGGGVLGCFALLLAGPEHAHTAGTPTSSGISAKHAANAQQASVPYEIPMPSFDMTLQRRDGHDVAFPLHVTGADDDADTSVTLRDMPESVMLTSGERRDEHTWSLRLSDLENLQAMIADGTPARFDVMIEVASAATVQVARTMARVRLLDGADLAAAKSTPARAAATSIDDLLASRPASTQAAQPAERTAHAAAEPARSSSTRPAAARPKPAPEASPQPAADAPLEPRAHRPDGASALGGPGREAQPDVRLEGRQVWWSIPVADWSPFKDGPGRN